MRPIDADAVIRFIVNIQRENEDRLFTYEEVKKFIRDAPTIEAAPVRHGLWKGWTTSKFTGKYDDGEPIYKDYVYYTCSKCYRKSAIKEPYCPSCGWKMDRGGDNAG